MSPIHQSWFATSHTRHHSTDTSGSGLKGHLIINVLYEDSYYTTLTGRQYSPIKLRLGVSLLAVARSGILSHGGGRIVQQVLTIVKLPKGVLISDGIRIPACDLYLNAGGDKANAAARPHH